jgi:hypothetical protein
VCASTVPGTRRTFLILGKSREKKRTLSAENATGTEKGQFEILPPLWGRKNREKKRTLSIENENTTGTVKAQFEILRPRRLKRE